VTNKVISSAASSASDPLGVEVARCMSELREDRNVLRSVRQLIAQRRIELSEELNDTAAAIEQVAFIVKMAAEVPGVKGSEAADIAGEKVAAFNLGNWQKQLEQTFEALRQQAAELRQPTSGEDFSSQQSSDALQRLGDFKRRSGNRR
jgi:hypothetical protein